MRCRYDEHAPQTAEGWEALAIIVSGIDFFRWVNGRPVGLDAAALHAATAAKSDAGQWVMELAVAAGGGALRATLRRSMES